ncbi:hypothetical protein [Solitalea canadensis]|uniref:Uncharacterized protein n=1 Tax=Solitalea canadensis (strain ATCC 29591 / DSM 3403 / JCM 21819 / LMG 8368 / NBRC 15130 / NCIMB 12057 / USAM 9D) TaxID=929556 RepID=H8KNC1_SOLCM|nr:hypothetical protein [Solitalea canadensis]AFD09454.1 hypothetical protein Solca_4464 [Solitalea canadensis DSM 3403]
MTFEEFFNKKKIDLDALKAARIELYNELKSHYEQMSEKSYDHTKKFWFNKLRLEFPLKEETKPRMEPTKTEDPVVPEQNNAVSTSSGGYKPMFRQKTNPSNQ